MKHERAPFRPFTPATAVLALLVVAGAAAAAYRFFGGLGRATNLSDQVPWGLWVGVDVLSGVALAAGGFTTAALVYVFGNRPYLPLVRPAVLTAFLGYLFVGIALLVDLALPWHIWHPVIWWPEHSVMFEVAWCVMLYLAVLAVELAPAWFERWGIRGRPVALWHKAADGFAVVAVAFFVGAVSLSWTWGVVTLIVFTWLAVLLRSPSLPRPEIPLMLIIAGVVFSTMHQSSLGGLFLLARGKLDPLWWTPLLPVHFFLSAVAAGLAMVIVEATLTAKAFRRPIEQGALTGLGRMLGYALFFYLGFRLLDLAAQGNVARIGTSPKAPLFLLETVPGVLVPAIMLVQRKIRGQTGPRLIAASLAAFGVVLNRANVGWLAMDVPGGERYVPSLGEILVTAGILASLVFLFAFSVRTVPILAQPEDGPDPATGGR